MRQSQSSFKADTKIVELAKLAPDFSCISAETDFDRIAAEYCEVYAPRPDPNDIFHRDELFRFHVDYVINCINVVQDTVVGMFTKMLRAIRQELTDGREVTKVIYPCDVLIVIICLAKLTGHNTAEEIAAFYRQRNLELQYLLPGMPSPRYRLSKSTVNTVMRMFKEEELERFLSKYFSLPMITLEKLIAMEEVRARKSEANKDTLAFDGQDLNASFVRNCSSRHKKAGTAVTVYNATRQAVAAYTMTRAKNHESEAFLNMLCYLDIRGSVVMSDALNSGAEVSTQILKHGADYLLPLKRYNGNNELLEHIQAIFNRYRAKQENKECYCPEPIIEKGHQRIEERYFRVLPASLLDTRIKNPHQGVKTLVEYTKISTPINGKVIGKRTDTTRYYISSLDFTKANAEQIKASISDYWAVERHHYVLDTPTVFNQDRIQSNHADYLSNTVGFNKIAYNVLSTIRAEISPNKKKPKSYAQVQDILDTGLLFEVIEYLYRYFGVDENNQSAQ